MTNGNGRSPVSDVDAEKMILVRQGIIRRSKRRENMTRLTVYQRPLGSSYCRRCRQPMFTLPEDLVDGEIPDYCEDGCRLVQTVLVG